MEITTVAARDKEELDRKVNKLMADGWKLHGNLLISDMTRELLMTMTKGDYRTAKRK